MDNPYSPFLEIHRKALRLLARSNSASWPAVGYTSAVFAVMVVFAYAWSGNALLPNLAASALIVPAMEYVLARSRVTAAQAYSNVPIALKNTGFQRASFIGATYAAATFVGWMVFPSASMATGAAFADSKVILVMMVCFYVFGIPRHSLRYKSAYALSWWLCLLIGLLLSLALLDHKALSIPILAVAVLWFRYAGFVLGIIDAEIIAGVIKAQDAPQSSCEL